MQSSARRLIACDQRRAAKSEVAQLPLLFENLQFLQPSYKAMRRSMGLFSGLRELHLMQDFVALVDSPGDATHAFLTPSALDDVSDGDGLTVVVAGDRLDRARHDRAVGGIV